MPVDYAPAIFHPHGNRGADLIETIRLQTLAGNKHVFTRPHPAVDEKRRVPIKRTAYAKLWSEPRWNRPQSAAATVRVHSTDRLQELLADDAPSRSTAPGGPDRSATGSPLPNSPMPPGTSPSQFGSQEMGSQIGSQDGRRSAVPAAKRRPHSALAAPGAAARAAHVRQQHEESQARVMAKLKLAQAERAAKQERDFKHAWESYKEEEATHVADIEAHLAVKTREQSRRATALCKRWNEEVFDKIQGQVEAELRRREKKGTYNQRWRDAQDDYLETLKKKEAGVFRDIIIESDYDPLYHAEKAIHYRKDKIVDPLKTESIKAAAEAAILPATGKPRKAPPLGRYTLPATDWCRLDVTPYGHFQKVIEKPPSAAAAARAHSQVNLDHYAVPRGRAVLDREFPKPKRTFHGTVRR